MPYKSLSLIFAAFLLSSSFVFAAPTTPTSVFDVSAPRPFFTNALGKNVLSVRISASQQKPAAGSNPVSLSKIELESAIGNGNFSVVSTQNNPTTPFATNISSPTEYNFTQLQGFECNKNYQLRLKLYSGVGVFTSQTTNFITCANGTGTETLPSGTFVLPSNKGGSYRISVQLPQPGDFVKSGTNYSTTIKFTYSNNTQPKQSAVFSYQFGKQGELPTSHDFPGNPTTPATHEPLLPDLTCSTAYVVKVKVTEGSQEYSVPQSLPFSTPSCDGSDTGGATDGAVIITTSAQANGEQPKVTLSARIEIPNYSNFSGRSVSYGFEIKSGSGAFTQIGTPKTSSVTGRNATTPTEPITVGDGATLSCATTYTFRAWAKMNTHTGSTVGDSKYVGNEVSATTATCQQNSGSGSGGEGGGGSSSGPGTTDDSGAYKLLVPSLPIGTNGVVQITGAGGVTGVMKQLFNIFLTVAIVLAVIFLIYGGAKYATSDAAFSLDEGKKMIRNAITGLAFALFSWLLLNTINSDLVKVTLLVPPIAKEVGSSLAGSLGGNGTPGGSTGSSTPPATGSNQERFARIAANEADVRGQLQRGNVGVTGTSQPQPCNAYGQSGCTMVGLVGQRAIDGLIVLKQACNCTVLVTAGTEYWAHGAGTTHREGGNTVDINFDNTLDTFIMKGTKTTLQCNGPTQPFTAKYTLRGVSGTYYKEDCPGRAPHWHVQF